MKDCDPSQNMLILFHLLPQLPFIISETEERYYHQKLNVLLAPE